MACAITADEYFKDIVIREKGSSSTWAQQAAKAHRDASRIMFCQGRVLVDAGEPVWYVVPGQNARDDLDLLVGHSSLDWRESAGYFTPGPHRHVRLASAFHGRAFGPESSSVFSVISPTGGIRPPDRHRAKQALSLSEREEISRWLSMRRSLRSIARHLGRSASTVSREVSRNGGADHYRAAGSDQAACDRARRPKLCKLAFESSIVPPCRRSACIRLTCRSAALSSFWYQHSRVEYG